MLNLARSLSECGNEVKIVALNTVKHFVKPGTLPLLFIDTFQLESIAVDTSVTFSKAFFNLFSNKSYNIDRFYNQQFDRKWYSFLRR